MKGQTVFLSTLLFGALASSPVSASTQASSRVERDIEFAERLQAHYIDLAEDFLGRLEKNPGLREEDQARLRLIRASILSRRAAAEIDLDTKIEILQQSIAVIEDFLKKYPSHPSAVNARVRIGEIGREMGDAIIEVIQDETDPKKIEKLRNQAEKTFKDAEDFFRKEIEKLANPQDEEQEKALAIARFNYPKTQYRHAMLFEKGHETRNFLLKDAIRNLEDALFELGNPDLPATYDAMITKGLVFREIGDWKRAQESFQEALAMKDYYEDPDNPGKYQWDDVAPFIIANAYLELCIAANRFQDWNATIESSAECLRILPDVRFDPLGWRILIERAKALNQAGQSEEAEKAARQVINADPRGYFGAVARNLIGRMVEDAENATAPQLLTAGRAELQKGGDRGLEFLRRAVRKALEKGDQAKIAADAYYFMALYYDNERRDEEAALAYLQVPVVDPKHPNASECIYRAASALNQLAGEGSAFYDSQYQKAFRELMSKYPKSKEAEKAPLFVGRRLLAKKQFLDAAKAFEAIPETSSNFIEAVILTAHCYYLQGRDLTRQAKADPARMAFEKAIQISRKAYDKASKLALATQREEEQIAYRESAFASLTRVSEIYLEDAVNKPEDALKNIEGLEKTFTEAPKVARLLNLRLQAYIGLNRLDEAASTLDVLLKSEGSERGLSSACRAVAARLEKDAEEREKKQKSDPRIATNLRRAANYYQQWIERGRATNELRRGPDDYLVAADRLVAIGEKINDTGSFTTVLDFEDKKIGDPSYWQQASALYETTLKPPLREALGQNVYQVRIKSARALAVLKQWSKVVEGLEVLVRAENLLNPLTERLNVNVVNQKPALLDAYALLGLGHYVLGREKRDSAMLGKATDIFAKIQENTVANSLLWWQARYLIVNSLFDQGEYRSAKTVLDSILNNYPDWDSGKFGLKQRFERLKDRVDARVPN